MVVSGLGVELGGGKGGRSRGSTATAATHAVTPRVTTGKATRTKRKSHAPPTTCFAVLVSESSATASTGLMAGFRESRKTLFLLAYRSLGVVFSFELWPLYQGGGLWGSQVVRAQHCWEDSYCKQDWWRNLNNRCLYSTVRYASRVVNQAVPSGFEDFPPSPTCHLSPNNSLQERENKNNSNREDNGMFSIGQLLRIRLGPLNGCLCCVLSVRRSEVIVKLDSLHKILTVKYKHLSEVRGRNSTISQGDDSGSVKPFNFLGSQDGSTGRNLLHGFQSHFCG
ncbi:unnamed protein product [Fraxinus pennsylvanica]|uniref:Uncharacterized protein n=1 Tax=Fraxinus pennsylvanica TaxID=56036 RepID=A0AAD1YT34_9LAMI|nr:unnamed protein product [Fraxinus pennsylvanica]